MSKTIEDQSDNMTASQDPSLVNTEQKYSWDDILNIKKQMAKEGRENLTTAEGTILCEVARLETEEMQKTQAYQDAVERIKARLAKSMVEQQ